MKLGAMFWGDEIDIRKEICFIFRNMGQVGEKQLVLEVVQTLNITEGVVNLITQDEDANAIEVGLKCLFSLLNVGVENSGNVILKHLERLPGCLERLEQLQHHNSKEIYNMVVKIFKTYFDLEESLMWSCAHYSLLLTSRLLYWLLKIEEEESLENIRASFTSCTTLICSTKQLWYLISRNMIIASYYWASAF